MKIQTSWRNPPSTNYRRPTERRFYVWRDRFILYGKGGYAESHGWGEYPWRWLCTMCDPPSYGFRAKRNGWQSIMTVTLPRHMRVRAAHHRWVAGHR